MRWKIKLFGTRKYIRHWENNCIYNLLHNLNKINRLWYKVTKIIFYSIHVQCK